MRSLGFGFHGREARRHAAATLFSLFALAWNRDKAVAQSCTAESYCAPSQMVYVPSPPGVCNGFGVDVALKGGVAVVGAYGAPPHGAAYAYRLNGGSWQLESVLARGDGGGGNFQGSSVATDGTVAVISDRNDSDPPCNANQACGAVNVFRFNGTAWVEEARLTASDSSSFGFFGSSVGVSGDVIVVGSHTTHVEPILHTGTVYIFRRIGGSWIEELRLVAPAPFMDEAFGWSIALDGTVLAIGSTDRVYLYEYNGTNWTQTQIINRPFPGEGFAWHVSLSGDLLAVGAPHRNNFAGAVYLYRKLGGSWEFEQRVEPSDLEAGAQVGIATAVNGDILVAGGPFGDCETGPSCGSAFLYKRQGAQWNELAKIVLPDSPRSANFGYSVAVEAGVVLIGAYRYGIEPTPLSPPDACGAAFFVELDPAAPDCDCDSQSDACAFNYGDALDCNGSGVPDSCDLASGASEDCNNDGVPDDCGPDCNNNLTLDECDIDSATSEDCDLNGVPDECTPITDCNHNLTPDACDIASATSEDCNLDDVPDECQPATDCNGNLVQDFCDLFAGTSPNCNEDEIPDECQLGPDDCNQNGIPDNCESPTDCNQNGVQDFCDLILGNSPDCNGSNRPDSCDIADATSTDVNGNQIPDECDTNLPPFIIVPPTDQEACEGESTVFSVTAGGMPPFSHRWFHDGNELLGQTSSSLVINPVMATDVGDYEVEVSNGLGSVTTNAVSLSVSPLSILERV